MKRTLAAIAVVGLMVGCSDEDKPAEQRDNDDSVETDDTPQKDASSKPPTSSTGKKDASSPTPTPGSDAGTPEEEDPTEIVDASKPSEPPKPFDYEDEKVELKKDLVIAKGKTVRVGPGTTFHANGDYKIQVDGTLQVEGSADAPAAFGGTAGVQSSWHGIVVSKGGKLELSHAHISDAKYGFYAEAGSDFTVTDSVLDTSFKTAVVYSNGSFTNTVFKAAIPPTIAITEGVSVDDPNGTLTIIDASPTIKNCEFAGASPFTDLVRIGGNSSPTFDFVYLHDAHCAFHTNGGVNTSPRITNAIIKGFSYGFMAYTTKPIVEDSVFEGNGSDFGLCSGATEANAPALKNNFYKAGELSLDASCFRIKTVDAAPATAANPKAGATGL